MGARKFRESLSYAFAGMVHTWKTQRNFRLHILTGTGIIIAAFFLKLTTVELLFIASAIFSVLVMELINTALETTVDLVTKEFHPLAFIAKNVGAAAVLLSALYALIIGLIIFGKRLLTFFNI